MVFLEQYILGETRLAMGYILFNIGPIAVHGYGLMIGIGIVAAMLIILFRAKGAGLSADKAWKIVMWSTIVGFAGGKVMYMIVEHEQLFKDPLSVIGSSGFVVYGGIIAGLLFCFWYCKKSGVSFLRYIDLFLPGLAIGQAFGRLGCFMAGCCYGREAHAHEWGVIFPAGCMAPAGVELIPTQLYSSLGDFGILAALLIVDYATRKKDRTPGMLLSLYLILYGVGRFIIEIFRNDVRGNVGVLSTSQFISIFMVAAAIAIFVLLRVNRRRIV